MSNDFTIIGDPHITISSLEKGNELFRLVENLGNPTIWLGDFLDTKEIIRGKCLNLLYENFSKSKLHHTVLIGNHDWFNLECQDHSLKSLSSLPNVKIIDKVEFHSTLPLVFFPYIHDKNVLKEKLHQISNKNLTVFGHFEVMDFDFGDGSLCEDNTITHDDFKGFKRVISGHFHRFQQKENFTYLGTPYSHSFSESNQNKVIGVYSVESDELSINPTKFPRHLSIKIDLSQRSSESELLKFLKENENHFINVKLYGPPETVSKFDILKYSKFQIKWEDKSDSPELSGFTLDETLDNRTQFKEWAKSIKNLDSDTISLGLSILEAVGVK